MPSSTLSPCARGLRLPVPSLLSCLVVGLFGFVIWSTFEDLEEEQQLAALFDVEAAPIERVRSAELWSRQGEAATKPMRNALIDPDASIRYYATMALIMMPQEQSRPFLPDVLRLCEDADVHVHSNALHLAVHVAPDSPAVRALLAGRLTHPESTIADSAYVLLANVGPGVVPKLVETSRHASPAIRLRCIELLRSSAYDPAFGEAAMNALSDHLTDPDEAVRELAYQSVSLLRPLTLSERRAGLNDSSGSIVRLTLAPSWVELSPEAARAMPQLTSLLSTKPDLRREVLQALGEIGPSARTSLSAILPLIEDSHSAVRSAAAFALVRISEDQTLTVPLLSQLLTDDDAGVALTAGQLLARVSPAKARRAVHEVVLPRLVSGEETTELAAASALCGLAESSVSALPQLIALIESESTRPAVRFRLAQAIGHVGPAAKDAIPALIKLINRTSPRQRELGEVVAALGKIGRPEPAVLAILLQLHDHPTHLPTSTRRDVIRALGALGDGSAEIVERLTVAVTNSANERLRMEALWGIAALKTDPAISIPLYTAALRDERTNVRTTACLLLAKAGPDAGFAVPQLMALLYDDNPYVRTLAADCLRAIGPDAADALPALQAALEDPFNAWPNGLHEVSEDFDWNAFGGELRATKGQSVNQAVRSALAVIHADELPSS